MPDRDFEFMFHFDVEASVYARRQKSCSAILRGPVGASALSGRVQ